jgi:small GTP-binding protein
MGCCGSKQVEAASPIVLGIFGLDDAGKTCLLQALSGEFDFDCVPTVGLGQKTLLYDTNQVTFYDLGGNSRFRSVWQKFFAELWGFIWVVDSSNPDRFEESVEVLETVRNHKMMTNKPFVVLANKQDTEGAVKAAELRTACKFSDEIKIIETVVTEVVGGKCSPALTAAVSGLIEKIFASYATIDGQVKRDMEEQKAIDARERAEKEQRVRERREADGEDPAA